MLALSVITAAALTTVSAVPAAAQFASFCPGNAVGGVIYMEQSYAANFTKTSGGMTNRYEFVAVALDGSGQVINGVASANAIMCEANVDGIVPMTDVQVNSMTMPDDMWGGNANV